MASFTSIILGPCFNYDEAWRVLLAKRSDFAGVLERMAIEPAQQDAFLARLPTSNVRPPKAANDNGLAWPFIRFPEAWYATC